MDDAALAGAITSQLGLGDFAEAIASRAILLLKRHRDATRSAAAPPAGLAVAAITSAIQYTLFPREIPYRAILDAARAAGAAQPAAPDALHALVQALRSAICPAHERYPLRRMKVAASVCASCFAILPPFQSGMAPHVPTRLLAGATAAVQSVVKAGATAIEAAVGQAVKAYQHARFTLGDREALATIAGLATTALDASRLGDLAKRLGVPRATLREAALCIQGKEQAGDGPGYRPARASPPRGLPRGPAPPGRVEARPDTKVRPPPRPAPAPAATPPAATPPAPATIVPPSPAPAPAAPQLQLPPTPQLQPPIPASPPPVPAATTTATSTSAPSPAPVVVEPRVAPAPPAQAAMATIPPATRDKWLASAVRFTEAIAQRYPSLRPVQASAAALLDRSIESYITGDKVAGLSMRKLAKMALLHEAKAMRLPVTTKTFNVAPNEYLQFLARSGASQVPVPAAEDEALVARAIDIIARYRGQAVDAATRERVTRFQAVARRKLMGFTPAIAAAVIAFIDLARHDPGTSITAVADLASTNTSSLFNAVNRFLAKVGKGNEHEPNIVAKVRTAFPPRDPVKANEEK